MDLRSYGEQNLGDNKQETKAKDDGMSENDIKRAVKHFSSMNNTQLMSELAKQISAKRARGEQADIEKTLEKIKPFLNSEQRTRLEQIMGGMNQ